MAVTADKRAEGQPSEFAPGRFLREVYEELRKVVWPTAGELYRYTLVVIFTVVLLAALLPFIGVYAAAIASTTAYAVAFFVLVMALRRSPKHAHIKRRGGRRLVGSGPQPRARHSP